MNSAYSSQCLEVDGWKRTTTFTSNLSGASLAGNQVVVRVVCVLTTATGSAQVDDWRCIWEGVRRKHLFKHTTSSQTLP